MLTVISDLHLSDGTSSHNISHRAFSHFFDYIKRSLRKEYKELIVVFAGDTFDLLRSDYWLNVDDAEKPWGDLPKDSRQYAVSSKQQNKESHLKNILNNILETNKTSLEIIKQADTLFPIPIKKIIIPGNHDRMMEEIHDYGDILKNALGDVTILKGPHSNEDYGVLIRHGHEYDEYNFEADGIPIGDVNTVELFVRLPFEIKAKFPELEDELKSAEDIRPQWRIFDYLQSTYVEMDIKSYIENVVEKTIDNYFAIPYVKEWVEEHDTLSPLDVADKLEYMLYLSKFLPMDWAEKLLKIFSYFETKEPHYEEMAEKEKALYVAYGHTHNENVSFLGVDKRFHRYYINTGTWRERILASNTGVFSRYKTMTYAIFYKPEERMTDFPSFELWNGALRE
ncbi:MAG: metallophosphoesterase [Proteobacteria bacterium]|nr:metallophosphoesterase [Pseudomonadota bacterium]